MEEMMETVQTPVEEELTYEENTETETKGNGAAFAVGALVGAGAVIAGKYIYRHAVKPAVAWCKARKRKSKVVVVDVTDTPEESTEG